MVNSRNKGASFERDVKNRLHAELGLEFRRVLDQWAEAGLPDLTCEDDAFPFVIECKRYRQGSTFASPSHWDQVCVAAEKAGKIPALVYKFDRLPERWRVPIEALAMLATFERQMGDGYDWKYAVEMTFNDFCMVARELMCNETSD
jgi:Holliday junction resolvase